MQDATESVQEYALCLYEMADKCGYKGASLRELDKRHHRGCLRAHRQQIGSLFVH
jgi:hypothetical protein